MKTEFLFPAQVRSHWREQLARRPEVFARKLEETLTESLEHEDVVHAVARLSVPALADFCMVDVVENEKSVRRAFSHQNPKKTAAVESLVDHLAELNEFPEGRRALAGESVLFQFSDSPARQFSMSTPERSEIVRRLEPTSVILVPFVVLGATIAVGSFVRTSESGLVQGPSDLALAASSPTSKAASSNPALPSAIEGGCARLTAWPLICALAQTSVVGRQSFARSRDAPPQ